MNMETRHGIAGVDIVITSWNTLRGIGKLEQRVQKDFRQLERCLET
ncbi:hypothetical protein E2C01_026408 [Portunus trituberculatus]|uniref:Uncharacterized protein n=1 Tax=Portunus trituberculatus TaxID=210409 RepID=A0A5B7EI80_PORTR|nr:hypothetical protein [Portunus trituberculatus]